MCDPQACGGALCRVSVPERWTPSGGPAASARFTRRGRGGEAAEQRKVLEAAARAGDRRRVVERRHFHEIRARGGDQVDDLWVHVYRASLPGTAADRVE